jgi:pyridoxamine 5'-phosphate oxidase
MGDLPTDNTHDDADLAAMRKEYADGGLGEGDLAPDPVTMFERWFAAAQAANLYEPNAMVLATVSASGHPSSRMVLLKGFDEQGFRFFSNTASRKGHDLAVNPACALLFPWHLLERQVRIEGTAVPLPAADVAAYFETRPRGSQLGAWASHQSRPVAGREELAAAYDEVAARYPEPEPVPVPQEWGGYVVHPEVVEFWQGRPGRMHDRLVYSRSDDGWSTQRLAP